jgi:hypothetical protein
MRNWPVPIQMAGDEKTVGGTMSFRQLGYMMAGFALGGAGAALRLPFFLRLMVFGIIFMMGVALSWYEVNDTPLDVYLCRAVRWYCSQRQFYLRGDQ